MANQNKHSLSEVIEIDENGVVHLLGLMNLPPLACLDCGKPYRDFPLDSTLSAEQWRLIHDSEGGVLCANCMVARAAKLPGVVAVRMQIEFA